MSDTKVTVAFTVAQVVLMIIGWCIVARWRQAAIIPFFLIFAVVIGLMYWEIALYPGQGFGDFSGT